MNSLQHRLLLETEYEFYRLQVDSKTFTKMLASLGWKPEAVVKNVTTAQLKTLNLGLRKILRSTLT